MGLRGRDLLRVNRVRKAQEAMFLSNITTANGRYLERHLLEGHWIDSEERLLGKDRSKFIFGQEYPTAADFKLWKIETPASNSTTQLDVGGPLERVDQSLPEDLETLSEHRDNGSGDSYGRDDP